MFPFLTGANLDLVLDEETFVFGNMILWLYLGGISLLIKWFEFLISILLNSFRSTSLSGKVYLLDLTFSQNVRPFNREIRNTKSMTFNITERTWNEGFVFFRWNLTFAQTFGWFLLFTSYILVPLQKTPVYNIVILILIIIIIIIINNYSPQAQ